MFTLSNAPGVILRVLTLFFLAVFIPGLCAQSASGKPHVSVVPAINATGQDTFDSGAKAAFDTVELILKQTGFYQTLDWSGAAPGFSDPGLLASEAEKRSLDYIVLIRLEKGSAGAEGTAVCRIAVYDRSKGQLTIDKSSDPAELLDIFDASDTAAALVLGTMTGVHIGFGSVALTNLGEPGVYRILLDGNVVTENQLTKVLNGPHQIVIKQQRLLGEFVVSQTDVVVEENKQATFGFAVPYLTYGEKQKIDAAKKAVDDLWDDPHAGTKMDVALANQEALLADVSWSPRLAALQKAAQERTLAWPAQQKKIQPKVVEVVKPAAQHPARSIRLMLGINSFGLDSIAYANTGTTQMQANGSTDSAYKVGDIVGEAGGGGLSLVAVVPWWELYFKTGLLMGGQDFGPKTGSGPHGGYITTGTSSFQWHDLILGLGYNLPLFESFSWQTGLMALFGDNSFTWNVVQSDGSNTGAASHTSGGFLIDTSLTYFAFQHFPINLEVGYFLAGDIWRHGISGVLSAGYAF